MLFRLDWIFVLSYSTLPKTFGFYCWARNWDFPPIPNMFTEIQHVGAWYLRILSPADQVCRPAQIPLAEVPVGWGWTAFQMCCWDILHVVAFFGNLTFCAWFSRLKRKLSLQSLVLVLISTDIVLIFLE